MGSKSSQGLTQIPRTTERRLYRAANGIKHNGGTAATIQRMVFGNAGGSSGAGVAFTRNPATGDRELYLDFQFNAQ
ncbi:MAG TPA: PEP/pyruvate-binding domain-containing protein, partial [Terriglobales bacterium]|nr:PEP/pyruvate-binding domain-containing protein [Terriglobales bacterium]